MVQYTTQDCPVRKIQFPSFSLLSDLCLSPLQGNVSELEEWGFLSERCTRAVPKYASISLVLARLKTDSQVLSVCFTRTVCGQWHIVGYCTRSATFDGPGGACYK